MLLLAVCIAVMPYRQALAQSKRTKSPLCTQDNALEMIKQQIAFTRTFNDSIRRITVLIRAADLLWPHQQDKARAAFTERTPIDNSAIANCRSAIRRHSRSR
jgi:hypothetical protein